MSRPLRIQYPGAWYHIMNRGGQHRNIFSDDNDRMEFLRLLRESIEMWEIEVHAYSLMNTHYHLLIHTPLGNLSRAMRHIDGVYTQRYNIRHDTDGQLFRGRYKSILIDKDNYLLEVVRYIHLQGIRAEIIKKPEDDPWTSHRAYLFQQDKLTWLSTGKILSVFNKTSSEARKRLIRFINKGISPDIKEFYSKQRLSPILGSKEFIQKIKNTYILTETPSYEIPHSKIKKIHPSITTINMNVCEQYLISIELMRAVSRGIHNEPRDIAVYLARKEGKYSLNEIADHYGFSSYSGVNSTLRRIKQRLKTDKKLSNTINKLIVNISKSL